MASGVKEIEGVIKNTGEPEIVFSRVNVSGSTILANGQSSLPKLESVFANPYIMRNGNELSVYNALRTVKIISEENRIVLIKTARKSNMPTVLNIGKLKEGSYFVQVTGRNVGGGVVEFLLLC